LTTAANQRPRIEWRDVHGILLLDKPEGISSNRALQVVRRACAARKAGHTGSLDVAANGLLPICLGEATKVSGFLLDADKRYLAEVRLGEVTTTGDREGEIVSRSAALPEASAAVEHALGCLRGSIEQVPPMFSALKREGRPLYELARQGIEVARAPRKVMIHRLDMVRFAGDTVALDIVCSKGTYVRSLATALGELLGCGAHLAALRRVSSGPFDIQQAHSLALFESARYAPDALSELLLPIDSALAGLPQIVLDDACARRFAQGQEVDVAAELPASGWIRVYTEPGHLLGIGRLAASGRLAPKRLLAQHGTCDRN
jgi:tRNA pseudouridine55 synthase